MKNSFKAFLQREYTHNELTDMANHGANTGHHGLIWTKDLVDLYLEYKYSLHEILAEYNDMSGATGFPAYVDKYVDDFDQFAGAVVYFCVEYVASELTQGEYIEETEEA
jgi:hypothetical protein